MKKGYIYIVVTALLYSTHEIAGKMLASNTQLDSLQIVFWIFTVGTVALMPKAIRELKERELKLGLADWGFFMITGTLCIPISLCLLQIALSYTQASVVAIIVSANVVFTVPFSYLLLKERLTKKTAFAVLLCLLGVVSIMNPLSLIGITNGKELLGAVLAILGTMAFALFGVLAAKKVAYYGGYVLNTLSFFCGTSVLFLLLLVLHKPVVSNFTPYGLMVIIYMGVVVKALGYTYYLKSIKETSAITASTVFLIKPALAPFLAMFMLGEVIHFYIITGILLVFFGSYIIFRSKKAEEDTTRTLGLEDSR